VLTLAVPTPLILRAVQLRSARHAAVGRVEDAAKTSTTPDPADSALAASWFDEIRESAPSEAAHDAEIALRRAGYLANFRVIARRTVEEQSSGLYSRLFWDIAGMMLIGMALLKLGVLTSERTGGFYWRMAIGGFVGGLAFKLLGLHVRLAHDFDPLSLYQARLVYDPGRLGMALGYVGAVMLVCQAGSLPAVTRALANVGRTALSNYIFQTVACVLLFFGVGAGLFGRLERWQLLCVVAAIWLVQLAGSTLWLHRFRFGPLEWLWRSLTYWQRQPMRLVADSAPVVEPHTPQPLPH
jgi:uncharacterized protein